MQLHEPLGVITPTLDAQVLRVLAAVEDASFTGRQVARLLPTASKSGVNKVLARLERQGIVLVEQVGAAHHYRLNDRHLAAGHIRALVRLKETLQQRVREEVVAWAVAPALVAIFGSAARNEMTEQSDIDLFVVRYDTVHDEGRWEDQLDQLAESVTAWTGNDARVLQMSESEVRESVVRGDQITSDISRDGLVLHGDRGLLLKVRS